VIKFAIVTKEYTCAAPRGIVRVSDYDISGGMTSQPQNGSNQWVASPQFFTKEDAEKVCVELNEQGKPFVFHEVVEVETSNNLTPEILETINKVIETGEITHTQLMDLIGLTGVSTKVLKEKARGNFFECFIAPYCALETTVAATILRKETSFSIKLNNLKIPLIIDTSNLLVSFLCQRSRDMQKEVKITGYLFNGKFFVVSAEEK
jgi:hypothetical protein